MQPTNDVDMQIHDAYWAMNRAHKGLHVALTSILMGAAWKDCQKAALLAEDKVNDAVIMGKIPMDRLSAEKYDMTTIPFPGRGVWGRLRLHSKKAMNAPNPEKMKKALTEALRITKEIEGILGPYAKQEPYATCSHSRRKRSHKASRKNKKRMMHTRKHVS